MSAPDITCRLYTSAMLAELASVDVWRVRNWHRRGWLRASEQQHRVSYFEFAEVAVARQLAQLHRAGASPRQIQEQLAGLERAAPNVSRPIAELGIVLDGRKILLRRDADLIEPSGQKRFEFESDRADDEAPQTILSPAQFLAAGNANSTPASALLAWSLELDEEGDLVGAMEMLRAALAANGPSAEWSFQLAEMLYRQGDLPAARERYYVAIELDEDFVEARANLGCVLAELGQRELAVAALEGAIMHHPGYADAHYHLARLLDETGDGSQAETHWQRFVELAPDSPWAEEALQRLEAAST
ncbi:Tetratricopeptide repeat protein [Anatilimnocola aggregata]|uniref:Tetratricopeptide repeat protein n=1 Tax=Anatilimnocola aggregata TaxID=2528021 RepID=A0A517YNT3_9BACT|nr:tetratricopeptide repeat protein [Anatilimnocola aggregata]QDU31884.1 Tetratricopeptide repeat protein [Anatilimnocola aggregata]